VKQKRGRTFAKVLRRTSEWARKRADEQSKRIPWPGLVEARDSYVKWYSLVLWLRSIEEVEGKVPASIYNAVKARCPRFPQHVEQHPELHPNERLSDRLAEWVFQDIFAEARRDAWMDAIGFYAVRDRRYRRARAYWFKCVKRWKGKKPSSYPSFEEWQRSALKSSELPVVTPQIRKLLRPSSHIATKRLSQAVERYVEWYVFACWARTALEDDREIPEVVQEELKERCPGFLEYDSVARKTDAVGYYKSWSRLLSWIKRRCFRDAVRGGWLKAIVYYAGMHPRKSRTFDYWVHWEDKWAKGDIRAYPRFEDWSRAIDHFVINGHDDLNDG
jgi:hypothetical protein